MGPFPCTQIFRAGVEFSNDNVLPWFNVLLDRFGLEANYFLNLVYKLPEICPKIAEIHSAIPVEVRQKIFEIRLGNL